jgi:hypothetical protein
MTWSEKGTHGDDVFPCKHADLMTTGRKSSGARLELSARSVRGHLAALKKIAA